MEVLRKNMLFKNPIFMGSLVFLFVLLLSQFLTYQRYLLLKITEQNRIANHAIGVAEELQLVLNQSFSTTKTLSFIVEKYGIPADFDSIADILLGTNKYVDALELVDGTGEITHVHPLKGNDVVGFNILQDSIGKSGALTTIKRKDYFTAGPIRLKQGGIGFVSRVPIFAGDNFSGFSAAVVKLPTLLNAIHIDSLQEGPFSYQLSKINPDKTEEIFFASNNFSPTYAHSMPIDMHNAEWKLNIILNENITFSAVAIFSILGIVFSFLCAFVTWQFIRIPEHLSTIVHQKTLLLKESNHKFKTLVEQASDGIFLTNQKGFILEVNIKGAEMLGYALNELIGLNLRDIYDHEELKNNPIRFKELKAGIAILHERKMIKKDGSYFYGEINAKMNLNGNFLGILRDITDRKEARKILEQQNIELKKTNSELDSFVYSASHELRAPLSSVLGLINIMLLEDNKPGVVSQLNMMEKSIRRLDDFIKDIIEYSRNKHVDVKLETINFTNLFENSLESLWYLENTNNINIEINVNDKVSFMSDSKRISIVLNNFISNAIKYHDIEKNSPSIWLDVITSSKEAIITIKDNGLGIEEKEIDEIFNMFYRVSSRIMGSGIGLFIVKEILIKLNGGMEVKSKLGEGSTFTIKIPNESGRK
jgi:PAS domain S-box-containing protein